jgi:hypothetical protein
MWPNILRSAALTSALAVALLLPASAVADQVGTVTLNGYGGVAEQVYTTENTYLLFGAVGSANAQSQLYVSIYPSDWPNTQRTDIYFVLPPGPVAPGTYTAPGGWSNGQPGLIFQGFGSGVFCDGGTFTIHSVNTGNPWGIEFDVRWQQVCSGAQVSGQATFIAVVPPDTTPPALELPSGGWVPTKATSADGAFVNFTVTARDDRDPNPRVACVPPSGSHFPIGLTQVECTATDEAGNTASANLTVLVSGWASGHGRFGTEGNGQVGFTLSNERVTFDRGTRFSFTGDVDWVTGEGNGAALTGTGTWNGQGGYAFEISVADNAPWGRLRDTIDVVVRDPAGAIVLTSFGPQLLKQGDIVVAHAGSS